MLVGFGFLTRIALFRSDPLATVRGGQVMFRSVLLATVGGIGVVLIATIASLCDQRRPAFEPQPTLGSFSNRECSGKDQHRRRDNILD